MLLLLACAPVTLEGPSTEESASTEPTGPCEGLQVDETEVWTQEGELLTLQAECASGAPPSVAGLPEGADFDEGELRWRPGPDQAGEYTLVFSGASASGPPETWPVQVHVADGWDEGDNDPVDPLTYQQEYGLPVLHVQPQGSVSDTYTEATVSFEGRQYPGASIKARGAASLGYPKNSFTLEFDAEDQLELSGHGLGNKRHLVLITTFDDNSYVRQELAYGLWADITAHFGAERMVVRTFPVVLYLDDQYFGLYTAADHVDDELLGQMGLDREGDLFKAVNHDANFFATRYGGSPKGSLHDGYEVKEGDSWERLDALVGFTSAASDNQILNQGGQWFDVEEMMDWLLFVMFSAADDSAGKNSYLAFDAPSGLMRFAPWDFNHCWGQDWRTLRVGSGHDNRFQSYNRLFQAFQAAAPDTLQDRWDSLVQDGPFAQEALRERVAALYEPIHPSAARDWERWGSSYRSYGGWSGLRNDWTDYEGEREYLEQWVDERAEWATEVHF